MLSLPLEISLALEQYSSLVPYIALILYIHWKPFLFFLHTVALNAYPLSAKGCGPRRSNYSMCATFQYSPQYRAYIISGSWGSKSSFPNAAWISAFCSSVFIANFFSRDKCGLEVRQIMRSSLSMSHLIYLARFLLDWRGSSWCAWFHVSTSNTVGASINLINGCSLDVALPSVWGRLMCELLVVIWWGLGLLPITHATLLLAPICLCCYDFFSVLVCYQKLEFSVSTLLYWDVVIFFSPVITEGSSMNILSFSLINATCLLVAVWWFNLQDFPKMHRPVTNNYLRSVVTISGTIFSLVQSQ